MEKCTIILIDICANIQLYEFQYKNTEIPLTNQYKRAIIKSQQGKPN